jgi:L-iditol 2-dehydrogenase
MHIWSPLATPLEADQLDGFSESSGVVTAVGSQVTNLKVGDRVALEVGLPCLECDLCKEGRYNICKSLRFRSSAKSFPYFQGTLQARINHPAVYCHK